MFAASDSRGSGGSTHHCALSHSNGLRAFVTPAKSARTGLDSKMLWACARLAAYKGIYPGQPVKLVRCVRKSEKATAGRRRTPTMGVVTVSKPTNQRTPGRASGADAQPPRRCVTPVGSGRRLAVKPHCVDSYRCALQAAEVGASTPVGAIKTGASHPLRCCSRKGCKPALDVSGEWGSPFRGSSQ